jgi:hypothetical protein
LLLCAFCENFRRSPNFWAAFPYGNTQLGMYYFDKSWVGLHFGQYLGIWSPCTPATRVTSSFV